MVSCDVSLSLDMATEVPLSSGRTGVRYRSAAEFIPHAEWLCATGVPARACECRYCTHDKFSELSAQGRKSSQNNTNVQSSKRRHLPEKFSRTRSPAKPTPSVSSRASRKSRPNPPSPVPTSESHAGRSPGLSPVDSARMVLAYVRVAAPRIAPNAGCPLPAVVPWPNMHELVWCKLRYPIVWVDLVIDFWPGIIKAAPKGPDGYLVTLLGNTRDVDISLHAILPYQAYRVEEDILCKLQSTRRKQLRTVPLDLEEYGGVEMDVSRFSIISSAFLFALSFSVHLATAWSWSANSETPGSVSTSTRSQPMRYTLRSQKHREERYGVLWWGPERIEERQLVQLKLSPDAIFTDPNVPVAPALATYPTGLDRPIFLQIHSIFYRQNSQKRGDCLIGPVVAGAIFDLVDEDQYGTGDRVTAQTHHLCIVPPALDKGQHQGLPSPPNGKIFRPLLKESYEIVLPVTVISCRYYLGIAEENISKHTPLTSAECGKCNPIKPTTFRATRAKMLEYAYEMSRKQARSARRDGDRMSGFTESAG
jgi:hypothetical protein